MRSYYILLLFSVTCILQACAQSAPQHQETKGPTTTIDSISSSPITEEITIQKSSEAIKLEKLGLVNIQELDSSIKVKLIYATPNNFTKKVLYDSLQQAYLQPDVAQMVIKAQQYIKQQHPELGIIIYDAARPVSIQRKMWNIVKGTPQNIYVSNPTKTGLHNYGAAVDLSLIDSTGVALDMGTPFDFFGPEAHIDKEDILIKEKKLTSQQVKNRKILRSAMVSAGFKALRTEWWHFNACNREEAKIRYKVID